MRESQVMYIKIGLSEWNCCVTLNETLKAKLRLQYRLQDAGAARNMKHLLRKLQALNATKKEGICALGSKGMETASPKSTGAY